MNDEELRNILSEFGGSLDQFRKDVNLALTNSNTAMNLWKSFTETSGNVVSQHANQIKVLVSKVNTVEAKYDLILEQSWGKK